MNVSKIIGFVLSVCVCVISNANALTFEYADGTKISGEIIGPGPKSLQVRTEDNKYVEIEWDKLSQATLAELKTIAQTKKDKKLLDHVEPYIEISQDEIIKKTEVPIKKDYEKLDRPPKGSLIGSMFRSSVGIFCLLLLYAANIYAAHEVATVKVYPPAMVCGLAAIPGIGILSPIIFLCMPTKLPSRDAHSFDQEVEAAPAAETNQAAAPATEATAEHSTSPAATAVPQTQVFKRGQFTFNRRFIETKFSGFFGVVRRDSEKNMVLLIKTMRGDFVVTRISRIASNDLHADCHKGGASHEVQIPFVEIQEIHIKHESA